MPVSKRPKLAKKKFISNVDKVLLSLSFPRWRFWRLWLRLFAQVRSMPPKFYSMPSKLATTAPVVSSAVATVSDCVGRSPLNR